MTTTRRTLLTHAALLTVGASLLAPGATRAQALPKMIRAAGGRIWSCFWADLDAAKVGEAHALGISVLAWTVNDPGTIAAMLDLGVDGFVTDRPDVARREFERRGLAVPAPTPVVA